MEVGGGAASRSAPGARLGARARACSAVRAPPQLCRGRSSPAPSPPAPRQKPLRLQHRQEACPPAGVFLRVPRTEPRPHKHPGHWSLPVPDAKTSRSRCSPAPSAHLIQAVDFLGGIHHFPAAGALRVHRRGSRGRRRSGGGWGLRGAAVTSPARPAPPGAGGKALGAGVWSGRRAEREPARRAGRRRGRGWARGGAWRLGAAALSGSARLRLGLRAARSASPAPQVPVTHTHSRPPLLARAPPPRCRRRAGQTHRRAPNPVAGNEHVGHRRGSGGGEAGRGGPGTESSADAAAAAARPGSAPGAAAGGGQVGGGRAGSGGGWRNGGPGSKPRVSCPSFLPPARSPPFPG